MLVFLFGSSYGQGFAYPSIKSKGPNLAHFVPPHWTMLDSVTGDLNRDGAKDAVIILEYKDSVMLLNNDDDTVLTQPRILLILFKSPSRDSFELQEQSSSFILRHENSAMDDPYQGISIDKGMLKMDFHLFYNMGSWYTTNSTYKFRYDGKRFILIGADLSTIHRATLDFEHYSYNFLTKKRIHTKGNDQKGSKKTRVNRVNILKPMTFETFIEPFSWEIENGIYL
jgi:hypothetical protein